MSIKTGKKIGFFAALAMLIGSVVGIGIFFKNGSVLDAAKGNGTTVLIAWIVGGLLALAAAISFSEIGSMKVDKITGLPAWSKKVGGKKYGYFVKTTFTTFYWGFLTPIIGYFVSELFFLMLKSWGVVSNVPEVWINGLVGMGLTIFVLATNYISIKASGIIQQAATIIKFLPLVIALFVGISMPNTHNAGGQNYFLNNSFTFTGLLAGLPAVLFSYDAFLTTSSLTNKVKGGSKTVSKVVLIGLISIIVLYSLIAVSSMLHKGYIGGAVVGGGIIEDSLPAGAAKSLNIFVMITLFVSGYGVLNGVSAANISTVNQSVETNSFYGMKKMKNKYSIKTLDILYLSIFTLFGFLICIIPGMILGTDDYIDATSNFPTLFFFAVYATTILLYTKRRDKFQTKKLNNKLFLTAASLFIAGTLFIVIYQLIFGFTIQSFTKGMNNKSVQGLGLFAPDKHGNLTNLEFFITFISFLFIFVTIPTVNYVLIRRLEKRSPLAI